MRLPYQILTKTTLFKFAIDIFEFLCKLILANWIAELTQFAISGVSKETIIRHSLYIFAFVFIVLGLIYLSKTIYERLSQLAVQRFNDRIYESLIDQKIQVISKIGIGGVKDRFSRDLSTVITTISQHLPDILANAIKFFGYAIYIGIVNVNLAIIFVAMSAVQIVSPLVIKKIVIKNYGKASEINEIWMNHVNESNKGLATIKAYGLKNWYMEKFRIINNQFNNTYIDQFKVIAKRDTLKNTLSTFLTYGGYIVIGLFVLNNIVTLPYATKVIVVSGGLFGSAATIFTNVGHLFVFSKARDRIIEIMGTSAKNNPINPTRNILEIKNLNFSYDERLLLSNFNLSVRNGDKIAITGKNGSGKSTLAKLIMGIEDEYDGGIELFGTDLKLYPDTQIFSLVAYLPQLDATFGISPPEVLSLSSASHSEEMEKKQIAELLGISQELFASASIELLSGGERKKLLLSQVLGNSSSIMILDEPSNSLDADSKSVLCDLLRACKKSFILISHDNDLISCCDTVIALDGGSLDE